MSEAHARPYKVKKISVIAKGADVLVREYGVKPVSTADRDLAEALAAKG